MHLVNNLEDNRPMATEALPVTRTPHTLPDFSPSWPPFAAAGAARAAVARESVPSFEGIVGASDALAKTVDEIRLVAPTGTTVLITGETGTGKELLASAIHRLSTRNGRPFVKINCAAIPATLLESELFGHEKGAFTGAIARRSGRFEAAHGGTLFLDEIGDMPLDLQAKLLRVLQEHEIERLGSTYTQKVDVRVLAATNQDLAQLVAEKRFRSDLYYRLAVYPIHIAPLRDRVKDIPLLAEHFLRMFASRMNRRIESISPEAMETLVHHSWPGNIRELQNVIERAVILSPGNTLTVPPMAGATGVRPQPVTLDDMEREHILKTLAETGWVVGGPSGAAVRLGVKRTTLIHTMQRRGITRAMAYSR